MLMFVDAPKFFRVFRQNATEEGPKRVRIGRLVKDGYEFRGEDGMPPLADNEQAEVDELINTLTGATAKSLQVGALRFPEQARLVTEYYLEHASDLEKRLIETAISELTRAIRKSKKVEE